MLTSRSNICLCSPDASSSPGSCEFAIFESDTARRTICERLGIVSTAFPGVMAVLSRFLSNSSSSSMLWKVTDLLFEKDLALCLFDNPEGFDLVFVKFLFKVAIVMDLER